MKVVWSPLAIERAYQAAAYIALDKPDAALAWLDRLFQTTDRLKTFPECGRMVPEIGLPEYRELIHEKSHRVIYRLEKSQVSILTIRNFAQMFDGTEITPDREE